MNRLKDLERQLNRAEPDDPKTHMLRAIYAHEQDARFMALRAELTELGITRIVISRNHIRFSPYLPTKVLKPIMQRHFEVSTSTFPVQMPPKFWGVHILNPD